MLVSIKPGIMFNPPRYRQILVHFSAYLVHVFIDCLVTFIDVKFKDCRRRFAAAISRIPGTFQKFVQSCDENHLWPDPESYLPSKVHTIL